MTEPSPTMGGDGLADDLHRVGLSLQRLSKQGEDYIWRPCDAALPVIERAIAYVTTSEALVTSLRNQLEWAKEALEPFGDISGEGDEDYPDDAPVQVHFGRSTHYALKLGDLRLAASTLDQLEGKGIGSANASLRPTPESADTGPEPSATKAPGGAS